MKAFEIVERARDINRPTVKDYIDNLFEDFIELKGDRFYKEDKSILCGIARFKDTAVTVIGHRKGNNLEENLEYNFGMPGPEGYRKALRLMKQAEKFKRPIITFIDTPGAYPGLEAEQRGQGMAIAENLMAMSRLKTPIISIVTGEGSSGGALGIGVSDKIFMLENSIYSILSPEGFATILWKDVNKKEKASELMKLTAHDLYKYEIIDKIIDESNGADKNRNIVYKNIEDVLDEAIRELKKTNVRNLLEERYKKYRNIGCF